MSDSYAFVLAFALVALAVGGAVLVRRSLLSKAQPTQVCTIVLWSLAPVPALQLIYLLETTAVQRADNMV